MSEMVMVKEPNSQEKLLEIIYEILVGYTISPAAEEQFEELIIKGMTKVKMDRDTSRTLEAEENFRLLAKHISDGMAGGGAIVGTEDIEKSLLSLCPIYPIC